MDNNPNPQDTHKTVEEIESFTYEQFLDRYFPKRMETIRERPKCPYCEQDISAWGQFNKMGTTKIVPFRSTSGQWR